MTVQMAELFEHEGNTHTIIGMQGGGFVPISDVIVEIPTGFSTNLYRGYQGVFAVDEQDRLILKSARYFEFREEKLVISEKQVNQVVPMTGHILFGDYHRPEWLVTHAPEINPDDFRMFEAEIAAGHIVGLQHCTQQILERINTLPSKEAPSQREGETYVQSRQAYWDWTGSFLPRRYDLLRMPVDYFDFPFFLGIGK